MLKAPYLLCFKQIRRFVYQQKRLKGKRVFDKGFSVSNPTAIGVENRDLSYYAF